MIRNLCIVYERKQRFVCGIDANFATRMLFLCVDINYQHTMTVLHAKRVV